MVTPIEHEVGRFYVDSRSRTDVLHTVDLICREESRKPRPTCTCEAFIANPHTKGQPCPHIIEAVNFERSRLGL